MMHLKVSIILFSILFLAGCNVSVDINETQVHKSPTHIPIQENAIQAVLWQQKAAEYKALCYQAYNAAYYQLDKILDKNENPKKPLAIITDLDETVMDNSPFNGEMILQDENYSKESWLEWGEKRAAEPVPGAVPFFKYAAAMGVEIFYISNRYPEQAQATLENLKEYGLPYVDQEHLLLRGASSAKADRRAAIKKDYEVIMLIGDNLSDFSNLFENQSAERRRELTDSLKFKFGARYIVLPNAMYGDWLSGIYDGRHDWSEAQKDSIRRSKIIGF